MSANKLRYAEVFLEKASLDFDKPYTYCVPLSLVDKLEVGHKVSLPFGRGNKLVTAFVYRIFDSSMTNMGNSKGCSHLANDLAEVVEYKEIVEIVDPEPWLSVELLKLCRQMSIRYNVAFGKIASRMIPPQSSLTDKKERYYEIIDRELASNMLEAASFSSVQQMAIIETLLEYDIPLLKSELLNLADCGQSVLKTLEKKGLVRELVNFTPAQLRKESVSEDSYIVSDEEFEELSKKKFLTLEQQTVLDELIKQYENIRLKKVKDNDKERSLHEFLLKGVTGSGKTEVFLQLCDYLIQHGEKVIVLVPEISLTPQMTQRFEARFRSKVALLHSKQRPYERLSMWRKIKDGEVDIALGPRSAIFAPFSKPALIIIDEEHEESYVNKQQSPRYSAITVARLRQRNSNSMLLLASATPNVEDMYRTEIGKSKLLELKERASGVLLPRIQLVDLSKEQGSVSEYSMSSVLINEIKSCLDRGEQALVFLNRRGYTPTLVCRDCGASLLCPNCSVKMNYHKKEGKLICHYCGHMRARPSSCPECGGRIIDIGFGTEKIYAKLTDLFPNENILRMDSDTTRARNALKNILADFNSQKSSIMVGTQMVAKGHDFSKLNLVGILSIDQILSMPDLRADEKVFQLITQAAGRAGRAGSQGKVILEVYDKNSYAIQYAMRHDYESFYKTEMKMRRLLSKPPFFYYVYVNVSSENDSLAEKEAKQLYKYCKRFISLHVNNKGLESYKLTDVGRANLEILHNRFRWQFVIKSSDERFATLISRYVLLSKKNKDVHVSTEIDPA